jgi:hypothetical protein
MTLSRERAFPAASATMFSLAKRHHSRSQRLGVTSSYPPEFKRKAGATMINPVTGKNRFDSEMRQQFGQSAGEYL